MELSSTLGGASSSSALSEPDVFLSFRGEDTRYGFTGNLYRDLVNKDLNVYMDDKKLRIGKIIRPELIQAIEESKSAIVILSENYADSKWCLDELAKIVECFETRELILYPIFYRVDPSDVRRQRNKFDLTKYKTDSEIAEDRVDSWRSALRKVGNFSGLHIKGDRYETHDRDEIVFKISQELDLTLPIGLQETVRNLGSLMKIPGEEESTEDLEIAMELSSTLGGASSYSAPSKHDVFLSFRGEDTRRVFTGNLYNDLVRKDLNVYMDDKDLQSGNFIRPELLRAIEESKSAIVVLSENYTGSTCCLDELAKIVEFVETRDLILFPVFYRVDPSDVQKQRNKFDLAKYETNSGIAKDRVDSWRSALVKV